MAKKNNTCTVYSIDSNPVATELCRINAKLNKVEDNVISILGDARGVIEKQIDGKSNRVLMPLPEKAKEFVSSAKKALNEGKGTIHYFAHVGASNRKLGLHEGVIDTENAFKNYQYYISSNKNSERSRSKIVSNSVRRVSVVTSLIRLVTFGLLGSRCHRVAYPCQDC